GRHDHRVRRPQRRAGRHRRAPVRPGRRRPRGRRRRRGGLDRGLDRGRHRPGDRSAGARRHGARRRRRPLRARARRGGRAAGAPAAAGGPVGRGERRARHRRHRRRREQRHGRRRRDAGARRRRGERRGDVVNRLATALLAAATTAGAAAVLRARQPGGSWRWRRTNYRGREVDLLGGVATAAGAATGALACGGAAGAGATVVTTTAGLLGAIDDADVASTSKGLRGHLSALQQGRVTTGLVKLVGISSAALVASAVATGFGRRGAPAEAVPGWAERAVDVAGSGVLIAATANLVNLFDLRPGRALKLVGLVCAPLAAAAPGP